MKTKPYVYVAGPYTKGDSAINTHCQCLIFDRLISDGIVTPYIPLWSHFQHGVKPRPYQDWIRYDIEILEAGRFDAILRCPAEVTELGYFQYDSSGADGEVKWFRDHGLPCFCDRNTEVAIESLYGAIEMGHVLIEQRTAGRTNVTDINVGDITVNCPSPSIDGKAVAASIQREIRKASL